MQKKSILPTSVASIERRLWPQRGNGAALQRGRPNLWTGPLRTAITLLLATVPWSVSAQTAAQNENLLQLLSKLKSCVRANAPAAQAAGMKNTSDATDFFIKTCIPPIVFPGDSAAAPPRPGMLSQSDFANMGATPPGILRRVVGEEWASFVEEARTR